MNALSIPKILHYHWLLKALQAAITRLEFDDGIPTRAWFKIFREAEDIVPLGFPVRIAKRDAVLQALFDYKIYPPVPRQINGVVPSQCEDSHRLASQIMTLPCDQRYETEDMERIAEVFCTGQHEYVRCHSLFLER